ncbi:MAG: aldo/keto reductase [Thermaerobacter sp.]|nr:aldo/keto reductase [Thermaerobacter sp.]
MPNGIRDAAILHNGVRMPWLGLGVFRSEAGAEVEGAVASALELGYRHVDTATMYGNEAGVGDAVRRSGLAREDVFVTTKVWNSDQGYDATLRAYERSLEQLGFQYADLYLVHWPVKGKSKDTWRAMQRLYREGRVRAIGVCNFKVHHLEEVMADADVVPMVNQVEYHPFLAQHEVRSFCREHSIQIEAWAPLVRGKLDHPVLIELARQHGKTPAQVVLRWDLQHGVVTIPKSVRPERIAENAGIFDFTLSADDMQRIDALNEDRRLGPDPDNISF